MAAQALLEGDAEAITRKVVEMALEGDPVALRLCLERLVPRRRSGRVQIRLPAIETVDDVARALRRIVGAAAAGEVELEDAATLAALVDRQRQALETCDLAERVEDLEALAQVGGRR